MATATHMQTPERYNVYKSGFLELDTPFTAWEAFKLVLLLPLVPVRIAVVILAAAYMAIFNSLLTLGCDMTQPVPRWRRTLIELVSKSGCWLTLKAVGIWMTIKGWDNFQKGRELGGILIFNHVSYCDAFAITRYFVAGGVSSAANDRIPLIGRAIRALQNISVELDRRPGAQPANGQGKRITDLIKERANNRALPPLAIAPEGTCGTGRGLLKFKTGAFVPGKPVMPVVLRYSMKCHNPAWSVINELWSLVRLCCQFVTFLEVEVLPPYVPSELEQQDPLVYAANVRKLYADHLGIGYFEEDRSFMVALTKAGIGVSWDGRRIVAPPGVVDKEGYADLSKYMRPKKEG